MEEYPNLADDTRPASLPCARWELEDIDHARIAFQRICPVGFVVENVRPLPCSNKPYCRWYAEFRTANYIPLPAQGEELKVLSKKLMRYKPLNSKFAATRPVSAFAMAIIYSRDPCPCTEALDFDKATLTPKMWPTAIKSSKECVLDLDISSLFKGTDD